MITRHARELEAGDTVWLQGRWRTVGRVDVEAGVVRVTFAGGAQTRLPVWLPVPCPS